MSTLRYVRRRLGSSSVFKMLLIFVIFCMLQMCVPAPPRIVSDPVVQQLQLEQLIATKPDVKNRRPGQFYQNVIVHFDLKGAPPKISYFLQLLDLVAKSGATGILLEWEDMFPYEGRLEAVRSTDAYTREEVRTILQKAKSLNLDIIPLVQTFGHLEWILKLEPFRKYRDQDAFPQVLCLGDAEGVGLIKDAISQVVAAHAEFGIPYFHIGCDEAFAFGNCAASRAWMSSTQSSREELALSHMREIALHVMVKSKDTVVLAWNDMLKSFPTPLIKKLQLGKIIEPVVWDYSEDIRTQNEMTWDALAENFRTVWASSAYKGANFPSAQYIDIRHYEANNRNWIDHKMTYESRFDSWRGIIITGWQRYDHMAALCETLPMGTPSLVLQIQTALGVDTKEQQSVTRRKAASLLNCSDFRVADLSLISNKCSFPGWQAYMDFQQLSRSTIEYVDTELVNNHQILGWLSPYSRQHDMAQAWYLQQIEPVLGGFRQQLQNSANMLRKSMDSLFFSNTIDEIIYLSVGKKLAQIDSMITDLNKLKAVRVWPRRHFQIKDHVTDL
ncbi:hypothetical protein PFISCL1PPCAC_2651 [Pristionchus fissidentatus]|uniref:beta-N-acetylhexosaminidase n=1 Tax=Pristionchus fissidentatus TaxID=1538716 RepID=A0AAV5UYB7_9BILA|nr:hypothetical protein PFISCL1PPCAC_2651 [Pristionchus fissidentatus]